MIILHHLITHIQEKEKNIWSDFCNVRIFEIMKLVEEFRYSIALTVQPRAECMNGWFKSKGDELWLTPATATSAKIKQRIDERIGDNRRISTHVTVSEMSMTKLQKRRNSGSSLKRKMLYARAKHTEKQTCKRRCQCVIILLEFMIKCPLIFSFSTTISAR